jgi:hypothetical protein
MWAETKVPDEADLPRELEKAGLKTMEVFEKKISTENSPSKRNPKEGTGSSNSPTHISSVSTSRRTMWEASSKGVYIRLGMACAETMNIEFDLHISRLVGAGISLVYIIFPIFSIPDGTCVVRHRFHSIVMALL